MHPCLYAKVLRIALGNMHVQTETNLDADKKAAARICLYSMRHIERHVSRCAEFEFEDVICDVDEVERMVPERCCWYGFGRRAANRLARHAYINCLNPGIKVSPPEKDYDIFMAICQQPGDLLGLNAVRKWKERSRVSVCWLVELWARNCDQWKRHLNVLAQFDHVFLMFNDSVEPVTHIIDKPCAFLAPGVDTLAFCPYPDPPDRSIDVFSLGRRSEATHEALLRMAEQRKIFYIHDTLCEMYTLYPQQHRRLVANMAQRSRYFIANAPKINKQSETGGQTEISYRFLEGAAAGAVLIGDPGNSETFTRLFDWPGAVLRMPYDTQNIETLLAEWDAQPQRLAAIRKDNIIQSLRRHDWVYRWRTILDAVGLEPTGALTDREQRLKALAETVEREYAHESALSG